TAVCSALLVALTQNYALASRIASASRKRAVEYFDWRHIIARYDDLWAALATTSRSGTITRTGAWNIPHFESFQSYASRILPPNTALSITDWGRRALEGVEPLVDYSLRREVINLTVVKQALRQLAAETTATLSDLSCR